MRKTFAILIAIIALLTLSASAVAATHHQRAKVSHGKAVKRVRPVAPPRPLGVLQPAINGMNFQADEEAAYQVAATYWGRPPNCYNVVRAIRRLEGGEYGLGTLAESPKPLETCEMTIAPEVAEGEFHILCLTVVHEYGHLIGLSHSSDPANIMYPSLSVQAQIPGC